MTHLDELIAEAIYIIRETHAQFKHPCILYSGGKDSIVLTHLAMKAFEPASLSFTLLHIDTGHNFQETIDFRDSFVKNNNLSLIVGYVQNSINKGSVLEETGQGANRNRLQTVTLLETIEENQFDACMGGARRDEEKARAKERVFSHRDKSGQWQPRNQRPELWNIYNGRKNDGEHFRVFPLSNWTELDIWMYIARENVSLPHLYYTHQRPCIERNNSLLAVTDYISVQPEEEIKNTFVRFRTMGDATITGAIRSNASSATEVIQELMAINESERGNRIDDKVSDTSMEDRKMQGYF